MLTKKYKHNTADFYFDTCFVIIYKFQLEFDKQLYVVITYNSFITLSISSYKSEKEEANIRV